MITAYDLPDKQWRPPTQTEAPGKMKRKAIRTGPKTKADASPYPKGWDRRRVQALIRHYENQTDDDAIAEAEAAYNDVTTTMMQVPVELVSQIERLISRRRAG